MSIKVMSQIWDRKIGGTKQWVLIILADHANDDGVCWPSISLIAWKLGISERTVTRTIAALEADRVVRVSRIPGVGNRYHLDIRKLEPKEPFKRDNPRQDVTPDNTSPLTLVSGVPLTQLCHPTPDIAVSPEPSRTINKPPTSVRSANRTVKRVDTPGFDAFYALYPRKQGKEPARKSWNRLAPDEGLQATMAQAVRIQAASSQWQKDNGQYVPLPATWINQRRWEDVQTVDTQSNRDPLAPATRQRIIA